MPVLFVAAHHDDLLCGAELVVLGAGCGDRGPGGYLVGAGSDCVGCGLDPGESGGVGVDRVEQVLQSAVEVVEELRGRGDDGAFDDAGGAGPDFGEDRLFTVGVGNGGASSGEFGDLLRVDLPGLEHGGDRVVGVDGRNGCSGGPVDGVLIGSQRLG
ncbi:hypothetical protein GTA09_15305 [Rhodococcus hoagii]|nr:hypothetical protein [Prescottella equi]